MSELIVRPVIDPVLGNSSYLVAFPRSGIAAVIDPARDVEPYLRIARELKVHIAYALETHLHADFISGARELQARVLLNYPNAHFTIGAGAGSDLAFEHTALDDGDILPLGAWHIRVIETPGHVPEHISYLVSHGDQPHSLFTGGALLVGGVGRTDHLGEKYAVPLAHDLYHSVHERILSLPDSVIVYPTHGAGSFCNSSVSDRRVTTIGNERWNNRFALASTEQEFIFKAFEGLKPYPPYFNHLREINRTGPAILGTHTELDELTPTAIQNALDLGAVVIDIRAPHAFAQAHLPASYSLPLVAPLNRWAGWVIPFGVPIILVADNPVERHEAMQQLVNIGYDHLLGYLENFDAWQAEGNPLAHTPLVFHQALQAALDRNEKPYLLDVRFEDEFQDGHIPNARHMELGAWSHDLTQNLPRSQPLLLYCRSGNRAAIAAALLEQRGFQNLQLLETGFFNWQANGLPTATKARVNAPSLRA